MRIKLPSFRLGSTANSGFTILELLIVFTLGIFIAGFGLVAFSAYGRSQSLTNAAAQTKLLIQEARFSAQSSVRPVKTPDGSTIDCGTSELVGYRVQLLTVKNKIESYLVCGNQTSFLMKELKFPTNISFDSATTCSQILFDAISTQATGANCNIVIQGYGSKRQLSVDGVGGIKITSL